MARPRSGGGPPSCPGSAARRGPAAPPSTTISAASNSTPTSSPTSGAARSAHAASSARRVLRLETHGDMGAPEGAGRDRAAQPVRAAGDEPHPGRPHQQRPRPLRGALGHRHLAPRRVRGLARRRCASTTLSKPRKRATNASAGRCHTSSGVPVWAIRPSRITTTRSASANASPWSWVTASTVVPSRPKSSRSSTTSRSRSVAVELAERLVQHQQPRAGARARGPARPAAARRRTARRRRGRRRPAVPTRSQQLRDPRPLFGPRPHARIRSPKATLPADVALREELVVLEHQADAAPVRGHPGLVRARRAAPARRPAAEARPPRAAAWTCRCRWARARTRSRARRPRRSTRVEHGPAAEPTVDAVQAQQHQNSPGPVGRGRSRSSTSSATAHTTIRIVLRAMA